MSGVLLERIANFIKADLADYLEVEDAKTASLIATADRMLTELRAALGEALALSHVKSKRLAALSSDVAGYASKAEFAVSHGRDDLARTALARKLALSAQLDGLREEIAETDEEAARLEATIIELVEYRDYLTGTDDTETSATGAEQLAELDALFAAEQAKK